MHKNFIHIVMLGLVITPVQAGEETYPAGKESVQLTKDAIVADTHIDVPYRLTKNPDDVSQATEKGQFDLPRAKKGGLDLIFMSIYTPAKYEEEGGARDFANQSIDLVNNLVQKSPDDFALATCINDVHKNKAQNLISFALGMENGSPIEGDLGALDDYRIKGVRYITLAHSKSNHISDSSYDKNEQWKGLSAFGKKLVSRMNSRGVMIDISHLSDAAAWQVLKRSKAPVIASHSSLRHFVPGFHRNMSDEMLQALAQKGGVIQINFGSGFLTAEAREWANTRTDAIKLFQGENKLAEDDPALTEFRDNYRDKHPYPYASLEDVLDHIDRVVELTSVDHVGIGSDYDGVGDSLPIGLKDVSDYPNLTQGLIDRGYKEEDIKKILSENLLRVWGEVEAYGTKKGYLPLCAQS